MVSVIVGAGDQLNAADRCNCFGGDDSFSNTDVRFVGAFVFAGQGVGQIRIENDGLAFLDDEETTLAEPPKPARTGTKCAPDVNDESVIFVEGTLHSLKDYAT